MTASTSIASQARAAAGSQLPDPGGDDSRRSAQLARVVSRVVVVGDDIRGTHGSQNRRGQTPATAGASHGPIPRCRSTTAPARLRRKLSAANSPGPHADTVADLSQTVGRHAMKIQHHADSRAPKTAQLAINPLSGPTWAQAQRVSPPRASAPRS